MFKVETNCPIAFDSRDHLEPLGTKQDNSRNPRFIEHLRSLFGKPSVLDLGCSGGGFVKDCVDLGWTAIGLEGSDYSKNKKRAEWATIPDNLFTVDISRPFSITDEYGWHLNFDVITAWEVLEHIPEERLEPFFVNILCHLKKTGFFFMSISQDAREYHHVTVHDKEWWLDQMARHDLVERADITDSIPVSDWVRGPGSGEIRSFNLCVGHKK